MHSVMISSSQSLSCHRRFMVLGQNLQVTFMYIQTNQGNAKRGVQRRKVINLNDLGPEILVKEKALAIHGSVEQMRRARNLEYEQLQRLHRQVLRPLSVLIIV
jgi:hypothetical protein